jgi:hypothetical protein
MRDIQIIRDQGTLDKREWAFYYYADYHTLILVYYFHYSRATTRHKFKTVEWWSTYGDNRDRGRFEGKRLDAVPLPDDVVSEARQEFISSLRVTKSFEEVRGW